MKLIVIDLDRLKYKPFIKKPKLQQTVLIQKIAKRVFDNFLHQVNEQKICTVTQKDFGKKLLLGVKKGDPAYLQAFANYSDAIFRLKDDDDALKHENKMFRKIYHSIKYFRVGVILRREKAVKILSRLLNIG